MSTTARLDHLDGIRGFAALYVVWFHVWEGIYHGPGLDADAAFPWLGYGRAAVAVFIVISGYSLSLPLARPGVDRLPGGFLRFIARRARRILPPYYACLLLSWLAVAALPHQLWDTVTRPSWLAEAFSRDVVLSHLLVVHHLSKQWIWQINPPLWSIATEWTVYFVFPALLIPAWRLGGLIGVVVTSFLLPALLGLQPPYRSFWWAAPWYLGLFGLGMAAALVHRPEYEARRRQVPWLGISLLAALGYGALLEVAPWPAWHQEAALGLATGCLLVALRAESPHALTTTLRSLLSSRLATWLGRISYSLYLTHFLLVFVITSLLPGAAEQRLAVGLVVGTAASLAFAQAFFYCFERPTLQR